MHFWDPSQWNKTCFECKRIKFQWKMGQNFHICLRSGPRWLTPNPLTVSLIAKYPLFFTPCLRPYLQFLRYFLYEQIKTALVSKRRKPRGETTCDPCWGQLSWKSGVSRSGLCCRYSAPKASSSSPNLSKMSSRRSRRRRRGLSINLRIAARSLTATFFSSRALLVLSSSQWNLFLQMSSSLLGQTFLMSPFQRVLVRWFGSSSQLLTLPCPTTILEHKTFFQSQSRLPENVLLKTEKLWNVGLRYFETFQFPESAESRFAIWLIKT